MRIHGGGPSPRSSSGRLVPCALLVLAAVGGVPTPVHAAGLYTHTVFVERAIEKLVELDSLDAREDYGELAEMLRRHVDIVNYGALFPDVVSQADGGWGEVVHDTVAGQRDYPCMVFSNGRWHTPDPYELRGRGIPIFRAALIAQLMPYFMETPRSERDEKMIAFLFGVISHQEVDAPWHFCDGSLESVFKSDPSPFNFAYELELDAVFHQHDPSHSVDFFFSLFDAPVHPEELTAVIRAASRYPVVWEPLPSLPFDHVFLPAGVLKVEAGWGLATGNSPYLVLSLADLLGWTTRDDVSPVDAIRLFVENYPRGGIDYGAKLAAVSWLDAWDAMNGFSRMIPFEEIVVEEALGLRPATAVTVYPAAGSVLPLQTVLLAATVSFVTNTSVTWRVAEAGGGSVTSTGAYTAPATPGTYHVVATSLARPNRSGTAVVTVVDPASRH